MMKILATWAATCVSGLILSACPSNGEFGPTHTIDPVTGEHRSFLGYTWRFRAPDGMPVVPASQSSAMTDPELKLQYRTRAYTGQTTRYYEVEVLSITADLQDTGIYTFTTLNGALAIHNSLLDQAGFSGETYAQWRSDLEDWLEAEWMSANDYYDEYGT